MSEYLTSDGTIASPGVLKRMELLFLARARVCLFVCLFVTLMSREIASAASCETYIQSHYMFK
jgi:hypothetical protein